MNFSSNSTLGGCAVGADGTLYWPGPQGVKGDVGDKGVTGDHRKQYIVNYRGLTIKALIHPDTYATFEDVVSGITGDELEFLRVVNQQDYEEIREEWAKEYRRQESFRAFERSVYESDR